MFFPFVVTAIAFAAEPLLTPDGMVWLGPLGPKETIYKDVVGVDPSTGLLYIENNDGHEQVRRWKNGEWLLPDATIEAIRYEKDNGRLSKVTDSVGVMRRYTYDDTGRLTQLNWSNGQQLKLFYESNSDRISRIEGPGVDVWSYDWRNGLEVKGPGGLHYFRHVTGTRGNKTVTVKDAVGRQIRMNYAHGKLEEVVDPQGLSTRFAWRMNSLSLTDFSGRRWDFGWDDESGYLSSLKQPSGSQWMWQWGASDQLIGIKDPAGRQVTVQNNTAGDVFVQGARQLQLKKNTNGWVKEISDGLGVVGRFQRDRHGQITAFEDALGGEIEFKRKGAWLSEVYDRSGAKWVFEANTAGMLRQIVTPTNMVFRIERNARGEPIKVLESGQGETLFKRDAAGRISSVVAPNGRSLTFDWSSGGVKRIARDDGTSIRFERNVLGDITQFSIGDSVYPVARGPSGKVISIGNVLYSWNQNGQIKSIQNEHGVPLTINRDASGLISTLKRGEYALTVQRDSLGRPIQWREANGEQVSLRRDMRGRIVSSVEDELTLTRDSRGWISTAKYKNNKWKWLRDSSGRPTRILNPDGQSIGISREESGLIRHIRYPDGSLFQVSNTSTEIKSELINENGDKIESNSYQLDGNGQLFKIDSPTGSVYWRRDPLGKVVAVEDSSGLKWSKSLDSIFDQHGARIVYDKSGRTLDAHLPPNTPLWGRKIDYFSHQRDKQNRLNKYVSNSGKGTFRFDDMDRLQSICSEGWRCWRFKYDPRGFLRAYSAPGKAMTRLRWRPDVLSALSSHGGDETEARPLLAVGKYTWLQGPLGLAVQSRSSTSRQYNHDLLRKIRFIRKNEGDIKTVKSGMGGYYINSSQTVIDGKCRVLIPMAGPEFCGDSAFVPLNHERMDGAKAMPWHSRQEKNHRFFLPKSVQSQAIWRDPLRLVEEMQLLRFPGKSWQDLEIKETVVSYLDSDIEPKMRIGPNLTSVPLPMDDLTSIFVMPALRGQKDPTPSQVVSHILRREFDLGTAFDTSFSSLIWWLDDRNQYPGLALLFSME